MRNQFLKIMAWINLSDSDGGNLHNYKEARWRSVPDPRNSLQTKYV